MEYEEIVRMMGLISAATDIGLGHEDDLPPDVLGELTRIRNKINAHRLAMLGNGDERPYDVGDLIEERDALRDRNSALRKWIEDEAEDRGFADATYEPHRQCATILASNSGGVSA